MVKKTVNLLHIQINYNYGKNSAMLFLLVPLCTGEDNKASWLSKPSPSCVHFPTTKHKERERLVGCAMWVDELPISGSGWLKPRWTLLHQPPTPGRLVNWFLHFFFNSWHLMYIYIYVYIYIHTLNYTQTLTTTIYSCLYIEGISSYVHIYIYMYSMGFIEQW